MRTSRKSLVLLAALSGLLASGPAAPSMQNPAAKQALQAGPPGTFRVRVRLIPVDVSVVDQNNRPVLDLKREDFQVFENGRLQDVQQFSVQTLTADAPGGPVQQPPGDATSPAFAPRPARTFLIMMGRGKHQIPMRAVDALIRFVRKDLLPHDRVALFAYNRATDFTTDRERIAQVLESYKKSNDKIESALEIRLRGLATIYGIKEIPRSLQADIDKVFASAGWAASRQVPPGRITEMGRLVRDWDRAADVFIRDSDKAVEAEVRTDVAEDVAEAGGAGSQVMLSLIRFDTLGGDFTTLSLGFDEYAPKAAASFQDLQNLYTCIEYLRYMDGEKHLLFFTGGGLLFPNGNTDYDKGLISMANDARVSIEGFHTGGQYLDPELVPTKGVTLPAATRTSTTTTPPPLPEFSQTHWSQSFMLSVLSDISSLTGGRASVSQDIGKALTHLDRTTRNTYLLGYYPKDESLTGEYRRIQVKVNRPGARAFYRHGYYARDSLRPYNREEFLAFSRISAAGAYEADIGDLPFKVTTGKAVGNDGQPQIEVGLQIDPEKVGFKMVNDRHLSRLYVAVFYADSGGKFIGDNWKTLNLELPEDVYQRTLQSGIQVSSVIPAKVQNQILKVIVYDTWGDKVGSKLIKTRN